jgi:hypothetical protein
MKSFGAFQSSKIGAADAASEKCGLKAVVSESRAVCNRECVEVVLA